MQEHIFLENEEILISSTRLVIKDKTIVMQSICSIDLDKEEVKTPLLPLSMLGLGVILGLFSRFPDIGWLLAIIGAVYLIVKWATKRNEAVVIELSSGETEYITNEDVKDLQSVLKALNDVIIFRG